MAFGLPVITTKVGFISKIVKHEKNGLLIKAKSPNQISKAVQRLINDPYLRKRIIKNGYQTIKKHTLEKETKRFAKKLKQCQNI
jgi:glycosyltransferase involved in cell wall biosynthesis